MKNVLRILVALTLIALATILSLTSNDVAPRELDRAAPISVRPAERGPIDLVRPTPEPAPLNPIDDPPAARVERVVVPARSDAAPTIPSIVGTVKNHQLVPIEDAKVEVAIEIGQEKTTVGEADVGGDGSYFLEMPDLEPHLAGDFAIMVTATAPNHSTQTRRAALQSREKKLWRTSFNLPEGIEVRGHVVDEKGNSVGDAEVQFLAEATGARRQLVAKDDGVRTWSSGGFRIDVPLHSTVRFVAAHPELGVGVVDVGPVADLREGEVVEIVLRPTTLTGKVQYPDGTPVSNLSVQVTGVAYLGDDVASSRVFTYERSVTTDDRGDFELSDVMQGSIHSFGARAHRHVRNEELETAGPLLRVAGRPGRHGAHAMIGSDRNVVELEFTAIRMIVAIEHEGSYRGSVRINDLPEIRLSTFTGNALPGELPRVVTTSIEFPADPGAELTIDCGAELETIESFVVPPAPYEQRIVLRPR